MNIFWDMKIFWICFFLGCVGGHCKIEQNLGVISIYFEVFS